MDFAYVGSRKVGTTYFLPFDSSYYEQSQEVNRLFPLMSSIRNLAKTLSKVINKRQRPKSVEAVHQNSPANTYINGRLSQRRFSAFDDTWIRPYKEGIARANDTKNSGIMNYDHGGKFEEATESLIEEYENENDDLDIIFHLSLFDQSRDELDEPNYINYEKKMSDVDSMVSAVSEDELSLYCDALSRKTSIVRTELNARYNNFKFILESLLTD